MARDCTESHFRELLQRFGGPQQVLLVGELWERAESRALLRDFLRELFPAELLNAGDVFNTKEPSEEGHCKGASPEPPPQTAQSRASRFGLVFFLCRPESLLLPATQRQLREILRDVRKRLTAGGAVVGVILQPGNKVDGQEITEDPACAGPAVSALLALLRDVFPLGGRCCEVRAAALIAGHAESRRQVQRAACEALTAADEQRRQKPNMKSRYFSWRRWRQKEAAHNGHLDEETALTVLSYPNGDCAETTPDA
ncbi:uncharacterized protein C2orf72 homolog [Eleutherodactylus coqui]|uniref:uncharacterized protein C2orf72 homolog n=1 Tax=Eleutherodactylus coqui TaxID=57060 RepID=UPI0034631E6D